MSVFDDLADELDPKPLCALHAFIEARIHRIINGPRGPVSIDGVRTEIITLLAVRSWSPDSTESLGETSDRLMRAYREQPELHRGTARLYDYTIQKLSEFVTATLAAEKDKP